jgi:hypothetical protein
LILRRVSSHDAMDAAGTLILMTDEPTREDELEDLVGQLEDAGLVGVAIAKA